MQYALSATNKFIPVMKNDKLNLWRAVYIERCTYGSGAGSRKPVVAIRQGVECRAYGYSSDGFWKQVSYKAGIDLSNSYMRINGSSGVSLRFNAGLGLPVFRGRINIGIFYDRLRLKKEILNRDVIGATLSLTLGEIFYRGKLK